MSFNYLEVEKAVVEIQSRLGTHGAVVQDLEWVDFPVVSKKLEKLRLFSDLNLSLQLKFENEAQGALQSLVFSLRSPWVGLYLLPRSQFVPGREQGDFERVWKKNFGQAVSWRSFLVGATLLRVEQVPRDRVVLFYFRGAGGVEYTITVELFPARPNWRVQAAVKLEDAPSLEWRSQAVAKPAATLVPRPTFLRAFDKGETWFEKAYLHYLHERRKALLEQLLTRARTLLDAKFSKMLKLRTELGQSLQQSQKAQQYKTQAESIKAVLHTVPKDAHLKSISVYTEQGEQPVLLDEKFTVQQNVDKLFQQYKKLQRTEGEVRMRLEGLEQKNKLLSHQISELRGFKKQDTEGEVQAAERLIALFPQVFSDIAQVGPEGVLRPPKKDQKKWAKSGIRSFLSKEGLKIWIGKNHKENEELVIRLARGNDLWLHLKGKPGAHAVVQLPQGKSAALDTLLDAAALVAHYSGVSQFDRVEVDYTFRKFVKRVPGQKEKFLVTYTQNKTLYVKPDAARLQRLLGQE